MAAIARTFSLFLFLSLLGSANADPLDLNAHMCRGYFFVPVTLNSETSTKTEEERTLYFLYDSGASLTYADPDSIERVTGKRIEAEKRVRLTDGHIGDLNFNSLPTRTAELDHLSIALGREIDGVLAYDAFGQRLLTLDYAAETMSLAEGHLPRPNRKDIFSTRGKDKRPWLSLKIGKKRRKILIDTGSTTTFALRNLYAYRMQATPVPISAAVRWDRMESRSAGRLAGDAFIGKNKIETPIIESVPGTELLGGSILKHFRVTFDVGKKRVRLDPYEDQAIQVPPERGWGLFLRPVKDGLKIEKVLPNGPSAKTDLAANDVITHVNGVPIRERNCASLEGQLSAQITRRRGDESATVTIDFTVPLVN